VSSTVTELRTRFRSQRISRFTESVIREMTRQAMAKGAINLAQGFPDFAAPAILKQAAADAIEADINQYAITWGAKPFRDAIAAKYRRTYEMEYDPEQEITVCCGATEGMVASLLAVLNPGDEVVLFEPFYENYGPDTQLCGAETRYVTLHAPDWHFDPDELRRAFTPRTRAIISTAPIIPPVKCLRARSWSKSPLFARNSTLWPLPTRSTSTSFMTAPSTCPSPPCPACGIGHPGQQHEQNVLGDGLAGRLGAGAARSEQFHPQGPRFPDGRGGRRRLQAAGVVALGLPDEYYQGLGAEYAKRRDHIVSSLESAGFRCFRPRGAYYVMTDVSGLDLPDDVAFVRHLDRPCGHSRRPGIELLRTGP
jgi:aspartate/methionine/tyrosine aminotransferase